MKTRRVFLTASLAIVASCSSDKSTGPGSLIGTMTFTYSGGIAGTFNVSGAIPTGANLETTSWAAGTVDVTDVILAASTPRTSTTHDLFALTIARTTAGDAAISSGSCTSSCTDLGVLFGNPNGGGSADPIQTCFLSAGTVTITQITATRVRGTFSGTGSCVGPGPGFTVTSFTVASGTFDVPLVSDVP